MQRTPVALIDPNRLFREGLKALLRDGEFEIVAEAGTLTETNGWADVGPVPEVVLVDAVDLGDVSGTVGAVREMMPGARIVVLTTALEAQHLAGAIGAGADGYLVKAVSPEALIQSLRLAMTGEKVFPTDLAALLVKGRLAIDGPDGFASPKGLSHRETQILRCLVNGESNKMIANRLGITEATVKVHLKSLLRKINASNRTQAAIWAMNHGLGQNGEAVAVAV